MNIQFAAKTFTNAAEIMASASAVHKRLLNPKRREVITAVVAPEPIKPAEIRRPQILRAHDEHVKAWRKWRVNAGAPLRTYILKRCDELGVTYGDIVGPSRTHRIVEARHLVIWEIKTVVKPEISYPELGRLFGGRDHTSILHSVRKISRLMDMGEARLS